MIWRQRSYGSKIMGSKIRVGTGYDIHALVTGRKLILGGVEIPFEKGLSGWSDADALVHAVIDALLGAAAMGDIGTHFPPGDPQYHNISSLTLLGKTRLMLDAAGWKIGNIDATVLAERPKLKNYLPRMAGNIAGELAINPADVSVKAGTNEEMGPVGKGEGIAVHAVALVEKKT
jgi:2-C-methyl-D-erythritol 2,4-cyclodiphosphate synthase